MIVNYELQVGFVCFGYTKSKDVSAQSLLGELVKNVGGGDDSPLFLMKIILHSCY